MKSIIAISIIVGAFFTAEAQETVTANGNNSEVSKNLEAEGGKEQGVVKITGVRFAYPLIQKWIDNFNKEYPDVQIIIEPRGSTDPSSYDVLVEAYEPPVEIKTTREYVYIARYAVLPVANSKSDFAKTYGEKGFNKDLLVQVFFHDIYADKENQKEIKEPFTVYTRLQKAGAPITFTSYFGYQQKDVKGKAIAGSDEHLLKALWRDSTAVSYLPLPLIYDRDTKKMVAGIQVIPVDLNGNNKVNEDEKFYNDITTVIQRFESTKSNELNNLPIGYLHLSVDETAASPAALSFLTWIIRNGEKDLHDFGYLKPESQKLKNDEFEQFASKRIK
jgi:ABC-type phosphate transport system substrate-binding protein